MNAARHSASPEIDLYPGTGIPLGRAPELARRAEADGFGGIWSLEAGAEPFLPLLLASEHTDRLRLRTAVAVAFARNPMVVAHVAHELQRYSGGRFELGLGSQVRPHVERRFGETWSHPAARMREFVLAVRAIWACWNNGEPLAFEGEFYRHTLMTPMFDPGPCPTGPPRVLLAAVGPRMISVAAEVADGIVLHPLTSRRFLDEVMVPRVSEAREGRPGPFELSCPVLVISGADEEHHEHARRAVRKQVAFYASTPAYRPVLELHGAGEVADVLRHMSRAGEWDQMANLVDDDLLDVFAVEAPPEGLRVAISERFSGVLDRVGLYAPYDSPEGHWRTVASGEST